MLILGIDTSTRYVSLALVKDERLLGEYSWECKHNHSVELMPALDCLLEKTGFRVDEVEGIGVAIGPGSFNGLRVGLSTAKGIAYSLNIPIAGVSSLEAIAYGYALPGIIIAPVIQSGKGSFSTAFYKVTAGKLTLVKEPFLAKVEDIIKAVRQKTLFCGNLDSETRCAIAQKLEGKAVLPCYGNLPAYGTSVALLANARFKSGQQDNTHTLEPFYLKKPHITQPKNKLASEQTPSPAAKAIIWDMDGVIVDSASFHLRSWQKAFNPLGVDFNEDYFWQTFGTSNNSIIAGLNLGLPQEKIRAVAATKEEVFRQLVSGSIKPLPGAIDLIMGLKKRRIPMAIASSAPLANIRCILKALGIRQYFRALTGEEDVSHGKPDPEVFLKASGKLGIEPKKCLVIEDALQGVQAAKKAGMACLAVAGTNPVKSLEEADLVVTSLACINAEELLGLIK